jgi:5-formyltetrahydrofolate cyclo-ligase
MSKAELRQQLKDTRLRLTDAERTVKSREIVERLQSLMDWSTLHTVHCFEPLKELMEPDISGFMTYLEDLGVELFVPRKIAGEWEMISIQKDAAPAQFDAVIVPMLGFDASLQRIGYGGGYYDKFLASQPSARKVGVCYELGIVDAIPSESHDVRLDTIVTETRIY